MKKQRKKTRALTLYLDSKYADKLEYLRYTSSITKFIEHALDKLEVKDEAMNHIKLLKQLAAQEQEKAAT